MARKRKRGLQAEVWLVGLIFALGTAFSYPYASAAVAFVVLASWFLYRFLAKRKRLSTYDISLVDSMDGGQFEEYVAELFSKLGYKSTATKKSRDFGVDVVARRGGERVAIQAKRYGRPVNLKAIQEVVAGMHKYDCNKAMVVTNNYFTPSAYELANATGCELVDRDGLVKLIQRVEKAPADTSKTFNTIGEKTEEISHERVLRPCPSCGKSLRLLAGKSGIVNCPSCQYPFHVLT